MKMELVFATNNEHKTLELKKLLPDFVLLLDLKCLDICQEIPETGITLSENALQKARFVHQFTGRDCFADDTGLEVWTLNNEPGVFSARYAGDQKNPVDNMKKLLNKLDGIADRRACFKTVIALILNGQEYLFEGQVDGTIAQAPRGDGGFGYDPVFVPQGYDLTFAELDLSIKNSISHRALATHKLIDFLKAFKSIS